MNALRVAVLASGRGSNLQALIEAQRKGQLAIEIVGVFGDRPLAPALVHARDAGIPALGLRPRDFPNRAAFDAALFAAVDRVQPQLIVCAGYMRIISDDTVRNHLGRIVNIHPSLLPAYPGLRTHERALCDGVCEHGASVHFLTPELDGGPVISQVRVPVQAGDTAGMLAARVLTREHPLLIATVALFAEGRLSLRENTVLLDNQPLRRPLLLDENNVLSA